MERHGNSKSRIGIFEDANPFGFGPEPRSAVKSLVAGKGRLRQTIEKCGVDTPFFWACSVEAYLNLNSTADMTQTRTACFVPELSVLPLLPQVTFCQKDGLAPLLP
jgi:hypothetical protein